VSNPDVSTSLQGVIFDMDGVLVDSEPFIMEASIRMFAEKGSTVREKDFQPFIGTGEEHSLGGVAAKYGLPFDAKHDKARTYTIYLELIRGRLRPLPGFFSFLAECRKRRLKMAVASSADAVKVEGNLHELGLPPDSFDVIINGSEVPRKKPAPDIFLMAAEGLSLPPAVCLVVEDAVAGVAAAKAAGARCLALTTSYPSGLLNAADWIVADLAHAPLEILGSGRDQHSP
jgi:HAD superfamily hydrolase (TIGR01509 family)